jgi:hypothetical protein
MLHEKPLDSFHWKNKMVELDHLPDEPLINKKAAWEKLQGKLQGKPKQRKATFYWKVAACLLLVTGMLWLVMDQKKPVLVRNEKQIVPEKPTTAYKTVISKKDSVANIPEVFIDGNSTVDVQTKNIKQNPIHRATALAMEQNPVKQDTVNAPSTRITEHTTMLIDTASGIAVNPARKKLKVVHINELKQQTPSFIQADNFSGITLSRNESDNLLKIKLSPSN